MFRRRAGDRHVLGFRARAEQREKFRRYARSVAIGTPSARTLERASAWHPLLNSSFGWRQIKPLFNGSYVGVSFGDYHFCSVVSRQGGSLLKFRERFLEQSDRRGV